MRCSRASCTGRGSHREQQRVCHPALAAHCKAYVQYAILAELYSHRSVMRNLDHCDFSILVFVSWLLRSHCPLRSVHVVGFFWPQGFKRVLPPGRLSPCLRCARYCAQKCLSRYLSPRICPADHTSAYLPFHADISEVYLLPSRSIAQGYYRLGAAGEHASALFHTALARLTDHCSAPHMALSPNLRAGAHSLLEMEVHCSS